MFDTVEQKPPSKVRRYFYTAVGVIVTIVVFVAAFPSYLWYPFVYYREERTVRQFLAQVIAGNYAAGLSNMEAFRILYLRQI